MQFPDPSRRDFAKLAGAVMGGLLTGLGAGGLRVSRGAGESKGKDPKTPLRLQEPHICRGLTPTCKGEVKGKKNDCAGQAYGPTVKEHTCKGHNDCAGLGGCGEHPGENKGKEMGQCAAPRKDKGTEEAAKTFQVAKKKADNKFGDR